MLEKFVVGQTEKKFVVAASLLLVGGCQTGAPPRAPDTGLASLSKEPVGADTSPTAASPDAEIARMAEESARFLEERKQPKARVSVATAPLDIAPGDAAPVEAPPSSPPDSKSPATVATKPTSVAPPEAVPGLTDVATKEPALPPRDALVVDLGAAVARAILVLRAEPNSEQTIGGLVGALEAIRPGFLEEVGNLDSPIVRAMGATNAAEIFNHRQYVPAQGVSAAADKPTEKPAEPVAAAAKPVLSIATAALCSKVTSFGRYDLLPSDTFAADQPIRALVYVEVENFADQEASDGQRQVELAQTLSLFRENDTRDVWSTPEQSVRETARRARRDFYLVQQIDLPRNLSLGSYVLKVRVVDKISGAQAEKNLPIRIVVGQRSATGE